MDLKRELLKVVSEKTGWSIDEILNEKDLGDVERKLGIKANPPEGFEALLSGYPLGSKLYSFEGEEEKLRIRKAVSAVLAEASKK